MPRKKRDKPATPPALQVVTPGKYRVILADPAWQYNDARNPHGGADNHFKTEPLAGLISSFDVPGLADPAGCTLCMWATFPFLAEALALIDAWGFTYKSQLFTWIKITRDGRIITNGPGHRTRSNPEVCLVATLGKPPKVKRGNVSSVIATVEDAEASEPDDYAEMFANSVLLATRREHSRKPDEQYDRIQALWDGPYLELNARQVWPGWEVLGDEAGKFPAQPFLLAGESRIAS